MPHVVILYTANLDAAGRHGRALPDAAPRLIAAQRDERRRARCFPLGGTRVLAYPAPHFAVADGQRRPLPSCTCRPPHRAAGASARLVKQRTGEALLAAVKAHFADALRAAGRIGITAADRRGRARSSTPSTAPCIRSSPDGSAMLDDRDHRGARPASCTTPAKSRTPLRHFSLRHPQMTIEDGYAVQRAWVALESAEGRAVGHKIGLTSRAMQRRPRSTSPTSRRCSTTVLPRRRRHPLRALHRAARRGRARLHAASRLGAPVSRSSTCSPRPIRDAGDRDHRRAHRTVRSRHQGAAEGLRHDLRQRGQRGMSSVGVR